MVIAATTLLPSDSSGGGSWLCLLCGERGLADFVLNVGLFGLLGAGLRWARRDHRLALVSGLLFSAGIELAQVWLIPGRDATAGDLVANGLGAWTGWWLLDWWLARLGSDRRGRWSSATASVIALLLLVGGVGLHVPLLPRSVYFVQWTADLGGGLRHYGGSVLSSRVDALPLAPGRFRRSDVLRDELSGDFEVRVEFVASAPPSGLAPVLSIYDADQREILLVGVDGDDLVYRHRYAARSLRLDAAGIHSHDALAGVRPGDTIAVTVAREGNSYCMSLNGRRECGLGITAGNTWSLLYDVRALPTAARTAMATLWPAFVFGVVHLGMLAIPSVTAGFVAIILLSVTPRLLGFPPTPWWQILAAALLFVVSAVVVRLRSRRNT